MSDTPISNSPVMGYKVETVYGEDNHVVAPSTLANQAAEDNKGHNPDFFPSTGGTAEEQNAVGKGANPSADVATKNDTSIDPVFIEPSPTADGETVPFTVPAWLPVNAPITEPDGEVHVVGEEPVADSATDGVLIPGDGDTPAEVVPADSRKAKAKAKADASTDKA